MAQTDKPPVTAAAPTDTRGRIAAIMASSAGNFVEWFDFFTYAATSLYFAAEFFPKADRTAQLLNAAGIFAAGFLVRPLGGWFFGRYADRRGRRAAMLLSVLLMCAGSLAIAVLPTYATAGAAAPVLLLAARLLQGFSLGGEYGTSATYMSEVAISGRRGFFASFQYVTLIAGQLASLLVIFVLQRVMGEQALRAGGWRIPFLIGAVLALTTLWLRRSLSETAAARTQAAGTMRLLAQHWRAVLTVLGLTAAGSLGYYTFATYMQKYLVNTTGLSAPDATAVMTAALFVYMLVQPLFGLLSDRLGRRTMLITWAALCVADHAAAAEWTRRRAEPAAGLHAGDCGAADLELLYVDQRTLQGRTVPDGSAGAGRRLPLRGGQRAVRRLGRIRGAVVQAGGPRERLLLVRHRRQCDRAADEPPDA